MNDSTATRMASTRLRSASVVRVHEEFCEIVSGDRLARARYATHFPTPRTERLSPGNLVAVGVAPDGADVVVWRWYDAVVLGVANDLIQMWEPAHGEVLAKPRRPHWRPRPVTRAYLSAGLPGADWWVAGATTSEAETAEVELGEVERLYTENDLWGTVI